MMFIAPGILRKTLSKIIVEEPIQVGPNLRMASLKLSGPWIAMNEYQGSLKQSLPKGMLWILKRLYDIQPAPFIAMNATTNSHYRRMPLYHPSGFVTRSMDNRNSLNLLQRFQPIHAASPCVILAPARGLEYTLDSLERSDAF